MMQLALKLEGTPIQTPNGVTTGGLTALANIIQTAIAVSFFFALILCLFILILSGFQWMTSGGDKEKLQHARQRITYAIVGLSVVFLSLLIINVLGAFFGINILKLPGT